MREPAPPRIISYSAEEASGARKEHKIFFWRQSWSIGGITARTGKKVAEAVRKIMERELSPETRDIILRYGGAEAELCFRIS